MATVGNYNMPDELFYHKEHMWVKIDGNIARVGVDDFTQKMAGEASFLDLPAEGDTVKADDRVGTIETGKWLGKLFAPVSGKIAKKNGTVEDDATLVNKDPYGQGWLFEIEMSDPAEVSKLVQGEAAKQWLEAEIVKHAPK